MVAAALPELIGPSYSWDTPLTKEPLTDGILSRIRSVSLTFDEALSPDCVRKAVRSMGNRASMAPLAVAGSAVNPYNRWALKFSWLRPIAPVSVRHAAHGRGLLPETWDRNPLIAAVGSGLAAGSDLVYGGSAIGDHATSSSSSTAVHSFSRTLPPPHRVLLLVALGLFCWWANLRGLRRLGLEISPASSSSRNTASPSAEDRSAVPMSNLSSSVGALSSSATSAPLPAGSDITSASVEPFTSSAGRPSAQASVPTSSSSTALERRVLSFALIYFLWAMAGWLTYRVYVDLLAGDPKGRHAQVLQGITVLGAVALAVWPGEFAAKWTRVGFGRHLLHLLRPTLAQGPTFPDVLLADILTSFAKVLGDVWLTACFLLPRRNHHEWWNGRGSLIVPCLATLPYLIRFRQCIAEYLVSAPVPGSNASSGKSMRPLANALKYASAFPVIWLSALQDSTAGTESSPDGVKGVYGLW
ncbi:Predicted small molecule transporter [Ceraceosorus bombacis]|uniref:Predicted small molecule transporter n=1 Tax=Ceraceosorus bombacis TaxID=401625 RepID=A0A0P1BIC8_9BASI|nr:Predicted small molecule transporter [Ceraceosorus bombacis]